MSDKRIEAAAQDAGAVEGSREYDRIVDSFSVGDRVDREQGIRRVDKSKVRCPIHDIPDCSPLLNACAMPSYIRNAIDAAAITSTEPEERQ